MNKIDARGRACPEPVILTRKALFENPEGVQILVDDICAVENITRCADNMGYMLEHAQNGTEHTLVLKKK